MKKGILFDLDGTLWDSSKEVAVSWMMAIKDLPQVHFPVTEEAVQSVMGKTFEEIAEIVFAGFPKEQQLEFLDHCLQVENLYIQEHGGRLMEGLEETLRALQKEYHLYIVSNCQVGYIEAFLSYHKLERYFEDFESFGATGKPKGENIRLVVERNHLDKALYVGDTQWDCDAADFAGIPFIHARTGYGTVGREVPYVERLSQLPGLLKKIFETEPQ